MFNTKNLVLDEQDIPSYWVFQYYLNLSESLTGQDIKLTSIFNPNERTPSFCIYVDKKIQQYKFKDFSTGRNGNKVDLVKMLFNIEYPEAARKIVKDYNLHIKTNGFKEVEFKPEAKWEVDFVKFRPWNQSDSQYWLSFRIGMSILTEYNVKPIEYYNLVKLESDRVESITIRNTCLYGYFDKAGEVYKIYQPNSSKHKFHKVKQHLQGYDQLKFDKPYLVICSSLKDALCLKGMGYNIEVISPDSENTMIKAYVIEHLKKKYKKVITLFDNDEAGLKAVERYANTYKINGFVPTICKDISDAMKLHGFDKVHAMLRPLLKETLNKEYGKKLK
tara:strand:+ start:879 stop:1877 length:999 start_codon:yes stop_codon:yes gene_type:complete